MRNMEVGGRVELRSPRNSFIVPSMILILCICITETLAMKGLILNCMGKREEAMDHVKRGIRVCIIRIEIFEKLIQ